MAKDECVNYYTKGTALIDVYFPEDEVKCQHCKFCRCESDMKRFWCRLTEREVYYPFSGVAEFCPLAIEVKENQ